MRHPARAARHAFSQYFIEIAAADSHPPTHRRAVLVYPLLNGRLQSTLQCRLECRCRARGVRKVTYVRTKCWNCFAFSYKACMKVYCSTLKHCTFHLEHYLYQRDRTRVPLATAMLATTGPSLLPLSTLPHSSCCPYPICDTHYR